MKAQITHWGQHRDVHAGPLDVCPDAECQDRGELVRHGWLGHDGPMPPPPYRPAA